MIFNDLCLKIRYYEAGEYSIFAIIASLISCRQQHINGRASSRAMDRGKYGLVNKNTICGVQFT